MALLPLALLLAAPVLGTEKETVDGVLDKYVNASGGKEAWNKVEYRAVDGLWYPHLQRFKFVTPGQELEFVMKVNEVKY